MSLNVKDRVQSSAEVDPRPDLEARRDDLAGKQHAVDERVRVLQGELDALEGERVQAVADGDATTAAARAGAVRRLREQLEDLAEETRILAGWRAEVDAHLHRLDLATQYDDLVEKAAQAGEEAADVVAALSAAWASAADALGTTVLGLLEAVGRAWAQQDTAAGLRRQVNALAAELGRPELGPSPDWIEDACHRDRAVKPLLVKGANAVNVLDGLRESAWQRVRS